MNKLTTRFLLASMLLLAGIANAQDDDMGPPNGERLKELKAQKAAYITTKLSLTTDEAQRFWPVYNEFDEAREKLRKEMRAMHKDEDSGTALTEARSKEIIAKHQSIKEKELAMERTYSERFIKTIGAIKTLELFKAERDFNREVLHRFRERMGGERDGKSGPPQRRH